MPTPLRRWCLYALLFVVCAPSLAHADGPMIVLIAGSVMTRSPMDRRGGKSVVIAGAPIDHIPSVHRQTRERHPAEKELNGGSEANRSRIPPCHRSSGCSEPVTRCAEIWIRTNGEQMLSNTDRCDTGLGPLIDLRRQSNAELPGPRR